MKLTWEEKNHIASLLSKKYSTALNNARDGSFEAVLYLHAVGDLYGKFKSSAGLFTRDMTDTRVDVDLTEKEEAIVWALQNYPPPQAEPAGQSGQEGSK